ncbi:hypothetical protein CABS01_07163 [Colletotrichum abscissum]|uniref:uncharacterized protein n=1 Tax=Colletotrichum abscissum TaxID=1671311 RepID=UPI0027D5A5F7|nr:uncharacterized protein CABS01_07163 [Colletotrichum abscissum]KAK1513757.1 hypothetical protein CABS01_07163 [Colletotrichum abscissum]
MFTRSPEDGGDEHLYAVDFRMYTLGFLSRVSALLGTACGDFDLTTSDSTYTIDNNGGLVFEVNRYRR